MRASSRLGWLRPSPLHEARPARALGGIELRGPRSLPLARRRRNGAGRVRGARQLRRLRVLTLTPFTTIPDATASSSCCRLLRVKDRLLGGPSCKSVSRSWNANGLRSDLRLLQASGEVFPEFQSCSSRTDSPVRVLYAQPRSRLKLDPRTQARSSGVRPSRDCRSTGRAIGEQPLIWYERQGVRRMVYSWLSWYARIGEFMPGPARSGLMARFLRSS
jgi:hypothetical protein